MKKKNAWWLRQPSEKYAKVCKSQSVNLTNNCQTTDLKLAIHPTIHPLYISMCSQYILISILSQGPPFWAQPLTDQAFLTLVQPLHLGGRVPDLGKGLPHCLGKNINMWSYVSVCVCVCLCLCVSVSLCVCVLMCVYHCISIYCILSETVEGKLPWNEGPPPLRGPWWFLLVWEISGQHWASFRGARYTLKSRVDMYSNWPQYHLRIKKPWLNR